MVAVAAFPEPSILILDELLLVRDAEFQKERFRKDEGCDTQRQDVSLRPPVQPTIMGNGAFGACRTSSRKPEVDNFRRPEPTQ
jgi:hypothetical protein